MTMMSAKQVIAGLRSKNKELKMRIERAKAIAYNWDHHDDAGCLEKLKQELEDPE
ncbi:hypothetical protein LCGC14_1515780 [marine sediment metagenome]|uniref:Uncharacterized protein n=1 Tax=marine sediment metagenome TaxID=412755 RepID=A0A0F9J073_9ZZZZ